MTTAGVNTGGVGKAVDPERGIHLRQTSVHPRPLTDGRNVNDTTQLAGSLLVLRCKVLAVAAPSDARDATRPHHNRVEHDDKAATYARTCRSGYLRRVELHDPQLVALGDLVEVFVGQLNDLGTGRVQRGRGRCKQQCEDDCRSHR